MYDLVIIGGGPAGLSAAIYGKRAGLSMAILEAGSMGGGQVLTTYEVDNYLGLPGVGGMEMGRIFREHVDKLGVEWVSKQIKTIQKVDKHFLLEGRKWEAQARAVILATGAKHALLGCEGEAEFTGRGVSYCATCDGAFYKDREVAVIGGGDVALEDAIYLAGICKRVTVIIRRNQFRGTKILQDVLLQLPNVEILRETRVLAIRGTDSGVRSLVLEKEEQEYTLPVEGVFIAVGIHPVSDLALGLADMDEEGYVLADESGQTKTPGFFVAGDLRKKPLRQIVTAVADGANAATSAASYLQNAGR